MLVSRVSDPGDTCSLTHSRRPLEPGTSVFGFAAQEHHQSDVEMLILFVVSSTGSTDDPLADLSEVLNTDDDILGILSDDLVKSGDHSGVYVHRVSPVVVSFFPLFIIEIFVVLYL